MVKVFLSAGHGGKDPGAVAYGLKEKNVNLQILLACKAELERHGLTVVCSRTGDTDDPVQEEVREANKSGARIAVSFHTNAGKGDGSETFYHSSSMPGKTLAFLCEKYVKETGQNSRGVKATDTLYFLRKTVMPAVLCECAFIDNDTDNNAIDTIADQKKFGIAYAKAILEYLAVAYREPAKETNVNKRYRVQVGSFTSKQNAENVLKKAKEAGFTDSFIDEV